MYNAIATNADKHKEILTILNNYLQKNYISSTLWMPYKNVSKVLKKNQVCQMEIKKQLLLNKYWLNKVIRISMLISQLSW